MAGIRFGRIAKCAIVVLACAAASQDAVFGAQASEQISTETKRSTQAGASFTAPAAWTLSREGNRVVLTPPETDSHLAIVDVKAADAASAAFTSTIAR